MSTDRDYRQPEPQRPVRMSPRFRASARRRDLQVVAVVTVLVAVGLVIGHLLRPWLSTITIASYGVADVGGLMFLLRYIRTDWRNHPWGRHVMAFMACLEVLFTLALSRRVFGDWPGLPETGFVASWALAGIVWWRYRLQVQGERQAGRD